jgi:hypothetical protein
MKSCGMGKIPGAISRLSLMEKYFQFAKVSALGAVHRLFTLSPL